MKKIFFILPLLFAAASASGKPGSGKAEIAFSQGLLNYQKGQYAQAQQQLSRAIELNPEHGTAAYFLGMTFFHTENYPEAITAFNQAVAHDEADPNAFFYRGLSHYRLGQMDLGQMDLGETKSAEADFEKVVALTPDGPLKELAQSYLRSLQGPLKNNVATAKSWFVNATLTSLFDTNASLDPDNLTLASLPSDQNDAQIAVQARGGYHWFENDWYRLTTEASYYQSAYLELDRFNYGLAHAELGNQFHWGNLGLQAPVSYEFSLLGRDKYLNSLQMAPTVSYTLGRRLLSQLTSRARYDGFFQTFTNAAQDRDAWNLQLELAEYLLTDDQKHYVKTAYIFEKNWADGNDWDFHIHKIELATLTPFFAGINLDLHAVFTLERQFASVDSVLGSKRNDFGQAYGVGLSRQIIDHLSIKAHYDYYLNDSNQGVFTYNRHLAGVTFATNF